MFNKGSQIGTTVKNKGNGNMSEYYIRLDCAHKLFGKQYIQVSITQLTNNRGRADPNGRMGGDEVVEVRFMTISQ